MTRAIVLSGGANFGALQAGALQALLKYGVQPDMLVGVSAGALNAAWMAAHPSYEGAQQLTDIWRESAPQHFRPISRLKSLYRLVRGEDSLLSSETMARFVQRWAPAATPVGAYNHPRLFVVAARLQDCGARVFGDAPSDSLFDALMASSAMPPLFPPWQVDGEPYVDGGAYCNLPLRVAVARGADEIFALRIRYLTGNGNGILPRGVFALSGKALGGVITRQVEREIETVRRADGVRLHVITLWSQAAAGFWNFAHADDLIASGRQSAEQYLTEHVPTTLSNSPAR